MNTPNQLSDTPRTDAAWAKTFQDDEDQCRAGNAASDMRDACAKIERELTALTAERDQLRAQLHALNLVCGTTDADKCQTWVDRANARAERAEAELAAERARLDYLSTRGFEHRHHETGDHLAYEWTISSTNELKDVSLREVIDAAMKEGAK